MPKELEKGMEIKLLEKKPKENIKIAGVVCYFSYWCLEKFSTGKEKREEKKRNMKALVALLWVSSSINLPNRYKSYT